MTECPATAVPENFFVDIPAATDETRLGSGAHIVHRVLSYAPTADEPLRYLPKVPLTKPPHNTIEDYVRYLLDHPSKVGIEASATPLDIDPGKGLAYPKTCFLVLELQEGVNWEYAEGSQGLSAKQKGFEHEDNGLTFVTKDGLFESPRCRVPPACRILYWSIVKRTAGIDRPFNFHIATYQRDASGTRRLPTIFDPNVPNGGGTSIP
jgi:hypothetical protein